MKLGFFTAVAAASMALIASCGAAGVDRAGTRDNIIKAFTADGSVVDKGCVDNVLDKYSDGELKSIDDQINKSDFTGKAADFFVAVEACVTPPVTG